VETEQDPRRPRRVLPALAAREEAARAEAEAAAQKKAEEESKAAERRKVAETKPEFEKDEDAVRLAIALGAVGLIGKIFSAATMPQADTRTWDNLPRYISFTALELPAGEYPATLEFLDAGERRLEGLTRSLTITIGDPAHDTVTILSEHRR
jgi:hypothetical protein